MFRPRISKFRRMFWRPVMLANRSFASSVSLTLLEFALSGASRLVVCIPGSGSARILGLNEIRYDGSGSVWILGLNSIRMDQDRLGS